MLVRFSCGCIGTKPENNFTIIFKFCENDTNGFTFLLRYTETEYVYLPEGDLRYFIHNLADLVNDGKKYREIKNLLK